jgi:hypothetical protein
VKGASEPAKGFGAVLQAASIAASVSVWSSRRIYEDVNDAERLRHDPAMRWIIGGAATSAGQHNISLGVLETLAVPLPPLVEQQTIVESYEGQLSVRG